MNNSTSGLKDKWTDWLDKLIKEHARDLLVGLIKTWGVPVIIGQICSIIKGMNDDDLKWFAKKLEDLLEEYERRNKK